MALSGRARPARIDSGYLAKLVAEHRLGLDEAIETAIDLTRTLPPTAYVRPGDAS